ncbi:MAG TPA: AtzE family amidohydrolase [Methylomirabilota bacterium]|jgi:aspartyl-tRNA(Asn)/glutamyl-tRNA(Gln) amidotransferase subunit A|nr:AtzE family amidohydrolase [Methylomirabilota bacterium]
MIDAGTSALAIAAAVRDGKVSCRDVVAAALERIARRDAGINAFTSVLSERAQADAAAIDRRVAAGQNPGPLAGVPVAVKNLFDVAGLVTLAGSKINAGDPPAARDASAVARLRAAGAVLVGALNMDEYAYGFTTENTHYGPTRNPRDPSRVAGGSSGGPAAAVAAGLVPLTLGTDTNGSIRVPAALCGVFGLKPTFGRVSRAGVVPLAWSFDHVGPFARDVADLAAAFDAIAGPDALDPACSTRPAATCSAELGGSLEGLRIAIAGGHFGRLATDAALAAVARVATALGARREVTLPEPHRARAAAQVITAAEGSAYHHERLRARAADFDPMTRDRLLAAALLPAGAYLRAQRYRAWFRGRVAEVFRDVDVLLAPTTPWEAPAIGAPWTTRIGDAEVVTRGHLGVFTQPLSFIGLPVLSVPIVTPGALPHGVQLVAAPWNEAALFRVAARLEADGVVGAPVAM